ncbi:MAG: TIGR00725 family protein [Thaumarchaeota archaeon]|nr:TIGR00725 family protein [Nitrososphaerota archaeon]
MKRRQRILVIGYNGNHCPKEAYDLAYKVGREVAKRNGIVITGGLGGVMEAVCKGAKDAGGLSVGIVPQEDDSLANPYADIVIPTGIGYARDFINIYAADAVIVVGGGAGTLIEVSAAYLKSKPIFALAGSGGVADKFADTFIDDRKNVKVKLVRTPAKVVESAFASIRD